MRLVSLETIDDYEQKRVVTTPRSLEACYREGIDPYELLYRPPEDFYEEGLSPRIQELNFNLFEAKRKDSLTLARQTRVKLIENLDKTIQKSFSESRFSVKSGLTTVGVKVKEKKVKALKGLVTYETKANEVVSELLWREKERKHAEDSKKWFTLQTEKTKNDLKRLEEQKEERETQRREKTARKETLRKFQEQMQQEELKREKEREEMRQQTAFQLESHAKSQEKILKVEETLLERKFALEQKLATEAFFERERKKEIKAKREEYRNTLKSRSKDIEKKRKRAIETFNQQLEARREEFYRKKAAEDYRTAHFLEEQRTAMTRMKLFATPKDEKIVKTRENAAKIEEQKRARVQQKMELNDLRVQKQRQLMVEHSQFRKHINMLKQLKKDWNMRRKQRREEYLRALNEHKLKSDEEKIKKFIKKKQKLVRCRSAINRALDIEQFQLHEAVHSMALTKKWDQTVIDELAAGSVEGGGMSTAPETAVRPRTAKS